MENLQNLWGGFQDDNVVVNSFDNLVLGLNQNAVITQFEYSTATGTGGSQGSPAILIGVGIGKNKLNRRLYAPTKIYFENNEIQPNHPEYGKQMMNEVRKVKGAITHWLKAVGITEEQLQASLGSANNFETLAKGAQALMAAHLNNTKVDIFLQYQWAINSSADKTYLEIPKTLGYGAFVTKHMEPVGEWKEVNSFEFQDGEETKTETQGLAYVDNAGNKHRFYRLKNFMESSFAKQQTKGANPAVNGISQGTTSNTPATW